MQTPPQEPSPSAIELEELAPEEELIEEDLLVEDVSIDGMCGVY